MLVLPPSLLNLLKRINPVAQDQKEVTTAIDAPSTVARSCSTTVVEISDDDDVLACPPSIKTEPNTSKKNVGSNAGFAIAQSAPKIKMENMEAIEASSPTPTYQRVPSSTASSIAESAKKRKKAKIMLQLEEVKLKQELMELEE